MLLRSDTALSGIHLHRYGAATVFDCPITIYLHHFQDPEAQGEPIYIGSSNIFSLLVLLLSGKTLLTITMPSSSSTSVFSLGPIVSNYFHFAIVHPPPPFSATYDGMKGGREATLSRVPSTSNIFDRFGRCGLFSTSSGSIFTMGVRTNVPATP